MLMRAILTGLALVGFAAFAAAADELPPAVASATPEAKAEAKKLDAQPAKPPPGKAVKLDPSGRKESGKASFYGAKFTGKKTASGNRLNAKAHVAASKTLPLGTTAKVTNLETGKSDIVKIEDRGPFAPGRVVDVTPEVAKQIGLEKKAGVAPVVVAPIAVPQPDGSVKLGAGAAEPKNAPAKPDGPAEQEASTRK
jgi:rare lipoprotein A